jgi:septal ring factor EnvC (AmiA/AmiB activator)
MLEDFPWFQAGSLLLTFLAGGGGVLLINVMKTRQEGSLKTQEHKDANELAKDKQAAELKLTETEQAFKIYKEIVDSLKQDMTKLNTSMEAMEHQHLECREENAKLNGKIALLENKIGILETESQQRRSRRTGGAAGGS